MATTDTTPIPPSQNEGWGFYGTISRHIEPSKAWALALPIIAEMTGCDFDEVRAFLDSRHGRHFADHVAARLDDDPRNNEAAIRTTAGEWLGWTIGPRTSRTYGIPRGMPYLVGFVQHASIEAEAIQQMTALAMG